MSPLLANIVLNELDWWIASQWEQMPTKTKFKTRSNAQGTEIKSHAYRALRRSRLKEMHAVRYADDFKIFCATHEMCIRDSCIISAPLSNTVVTELLNASLSDLSFP